MSDFFICRRCGESVDVDSWNDDDICDACLDSYRKEFLRERKLGHEFRKWRKEQK